MSGMHFDNLLQDTPNELRPPSVIFFHGFETCKNDEHELLTWTIMAETVLPARERLLIASYDMDANPKRGWFRFTPEMDLQKRFHVKECGTVVFIPRGSNCDGYTKWCTKKTLDQHVSKVGCEDFVDKCAKHVKFWDKITPLAEWIKKSVAMEGDPHISPVFGSYQDQARWILGRDDTTTDNELRNYYLVEAFPAFTPLGFAAEPIPQKLNDWILDFWNRRKSRRIIEGWESDSTQMSFHEEPTTIVPLDSEEKLRDQLANEILKPIVEKWSGISPLELTSFYGIREYTSQWLRNHVDRIDTHVLSITFSLGKLNSSNINQILSKEEEEKLPRWPLEVVAFDGEIYRHDHPGNTMILYESSKLAHGRPYHNEGPPHLGAFCHFKPVNMNKLDAEKWEDIATASRLNQDRNSIRGPYKSTPSIEPEIPVFSKIRYGDHTGFRKTGEGNNEEEEDGDLFTVTFKNRFEESLELHWVSNEGAFISQGTLGTGSSFTVNTYIGHEFVWTKVGETKPLPKGRVRVEAGSRVYSYGSGRAALRS